MSSGNQARQRNCFIIVFFISSFFTSALWASETYALVIGVDNYSHMGKLDGAKNDADHIYQALVRSGVPARNVTKLHDHHASYNKIRKTWQEMIKRSKPNDHLILTFAGHGTQVPDLNGDERMQTNGDRFDETFLLSRFNWTGDAVQEQLLDDELGIWFNDALKKGRKVLFVADACNSGGGYRSINGEVGKTRFIRLPDWVRGLFRLKNTHTATKEFRFHKNFTFFSGAKSYQEVKEVQASTPFVKNGAMQSRGPLSLAFAEALYEKLGAVDLNGDKALSIDELSRHIRNRVMGFSLKNQEPTFYPTRGSTPVLAIKTRVTPLIPMPIKSKVGVKVTGVTPKFFLSLKNIRPVSKNYELNWGIAEGKVYNKFGDLIARNVRFKEDIDRVASRHQLVKIIRDLTVGHTANAQVGTTESKTHSIGTQIKFSINGLKHQKLIQFNLTGNGQLQCFDSERVNGKKFYKFVTGQPVGNDTLVTLAMNNPPKQLLQLVGSQAQCTSNISDLADKLPRLLKGRRYQLSYIDLFVSG